MGAARTANAQDQASALSNAFSISPLSRPLMADSIRPSYVHRDLVRPHCDPAVDAAALEGQLVALPFTARRAPFARRSASFSALARAASSPRLCGRSMWIRDMDRLLIADRKTIRGQTKHRTRAVGRRHSTFPTSCRMPGILSR